MVIAAACAGFTAEMAWAMPEAAAAMLTLNVSDAESLLASVAVTVILREVAVLGAVPEKVPVDELNDSQDGSDQPFDCVAA